MTSKEVQNNYKKSLGSLSKGELKQSIETALLLNEELKSPEIKDKLSNLEENYKFMLKYFLDGVEDTERKSLLNRLIAQLFIIISHLRDELLTRDSSNYEFAQKRYFPFTAQYPNDDIISGLKREEKLLELKDIQEENIQKKSEVEIDFERVASFLFSYFWLTSHYTDNKKLEIYNAIMSDSYTDSIAKSLLISAVTFNIWRTFDEEKLNLLLDACNSNDMETKQRALVGLCFVLAKYNRFIPYFPKIRNRLMILTDDEHTAENLKNIINQIIATTETDEVSRKLQQEIFPELMKLRPLMDEGLDVEGLINIEEWAEQNPEWEEMMRKTGVSDKIREFADMQMEGADVYMSTFAILKSFPFFNSISNWFIPFDTQNSAVKPLFNENEKTLMDAFLDSNIMCDSDRYSFCLSVLQMPESQRGVMKNSFNEASEQMEEMKKDEALHSSHSIEKTISKNYIQGLFRFFKLYPKSNDFANMFSVSLILHKTYLFDILSSNEELKTNVAEFYFSKKLYPQALELFKEIENETEPSAALYQKIGFAHQQTSQVVQALEAYKKADLIQPDDYWTLKKIALCHKLLGDNQSALKIYKHIDFIKPNVLNTQMQIANCYITQNKLDEALKILLESNEQFRENSKIWRAIVSTSFKAGKLEQAQYFSDLIFEKNTIEPYDSIIAGHIYWCSKKTKEALDKYNKGIELINNEWNKFVELFHQDQEILISLGKEENEISLLLDGLKYQNTTNL